MRIGMTAAFHIFVGKPKSFEKVCPRVCPRSRFLVACVGKLHGQTFVAPIWLLNIKEPEGATKVCPCCFPTQATKKRPRGQTRGQTFVFGGASCQDDASCQHDGAPRRLHLFLQGVHMQTCSGARSLRPDSLLLGISIRFACLMLSLARGAKTAHSLFSEFLLFHPPRKNSGNRRLRHLELKNIPLRKGFAGCPSFETTTAGYYLWSHHRI